MHRRKRVFLRGGLDSVAASLVSILAGLALGFVLLLVFNKRFAVYGFLNIVLSGLKSPARFAKVLYTAAPILMTGLSVGFAFRTGLFNIGATGQLTVGSLCALWGAIIWKLPWALCIPLGMVGGAFWGAIPGACKALFNVNEVITSIMFNWIGLFAVNLVLYNTPLLISSAWGDAYTDRTAKLGKANFSAILPKLGLEEVFRSPYINAGILIAMGFALCVWVILQKTTFGYELKACGFNRSAGFYAGINTGRNIILSMSIAGALAGIGGALYYLSGTVQMTMGKVLSPMGFNGIPVALLAASHPLGTVFSALFVSYIQVGGEAMQPEFAKEIIDIIIAAIIYLSAFSLLMRELIMNARIRKAASQEAEKGAEP